MGSYNPDIPALPMSTSKSDTLHFFQHRNGFVTTCLNTNDPDRKNKAGNNEGNNEDDLTPPKPLTESDRTDSERREATDALPPLMTSLPNINRSGTGVCTSTNTGPGTNTGPNSLAKALSGSSLTVPLPSPGGSRKSSSTGTGYAYGSDTAWSERDWADSEF